MKKILLIILAGLLITVAILFIRPSKSLDQNLVLAEELMSDRPDSALKVLEKLKLENFSGENKALYALLMTQAQFKNYKPVESDSLFKIAYNFYINSDDTRHKALVYFYRGRYSEMFNNAKDAINCYQKASLAANKAEDYDFLVLIYNRLGLLLCNQNLYDDALLIQNKSLKYSEVNRDTLRQIFILRDIGDIYTYDKKFNQALFYYKKALSLADLINSSKRISEICNNMGFVYKCLAKYDSGMYYVNKSIILMSDTLLLLSRYSLKGDLFSLKHQYDSAKYYLDMGRRNNLNSEASYCSLMSKLEERLGNYREALEYSNKYIDYVSKIVDTKRETEISELQKKYDYSLIKNENIQLELGKKNRNIIILILLIISIIVVWIISYRYNKIHHEKDEIIKVGKEQLNQMADKLIEWEMRLKEVQLKSKADLDAFVKWVFSKNEAMIKIDKLTNMSTAERIANKDELKLTPSEIANLKDVVDICFNNFASRLSKSFQNMTEDNILFCCLLRMKIPASSIALLLGVSDSTLVKRKYRLKKEVNDMTEGCLSLEKYLLNF